MCEIHVVVEWKWNSLFYVSEVSIEKELCSVKLNKGTCYHDLLPGMLKDPPKLLSCIVDLALNTSTILKIESSKNNSSYQFYWFYQYYGERSTRATSWNKL